MHVEPAEAFAAAGHHILLEKPMAPDEAGCRRIVAAVEKAGVMLAVGHVMRYTPYTCAVRQVVGSGQLGDIMSVEHLEPVGFWHQAHSYVRGNWRRAGLAASMLLAKSCHDLDWLACILGRAPLRVASFGSLTHFTAGNRPAGAADRCVTCAVEADCPYSAPRLYRGLLERGEHRWPLSAVIEDFTAAALEEALRDGPYGRCVYACDNDVVDHQVVALEFPGAATATFTMTAFTRAAGRATRLFGTRGELTGDGQAIRIYDEDGLYDPRNFNDRLVLGMKGQISEAELHFIRARLRGGQLSKARRGELIMPLPIGLVYDAAGHVTPAPTPPSRARCGTCSPRSRPPARPPPW